MKIENGNYLSINEVKDKYLKSPGNLNIKGMDATKSFADILKGKEIEQEAAPSLRFSKHASQRLSDRNINLSTEQLSRLTEATGKASEKGINDSLVKKNPIDTMEEDTKVSLKFEKELLYTIL